MARKVTIGEYELINRGYNNKIYKNNKLVTEFTDTYINAIKYVKDLK